MRAFGFLAVSAAMILAQGACDDKTAVTPDVALRDTSVADTKVVEADGGCPAGTVPQKPTVMLVIDRSSSMGKTFGTSTRWKAVRDVLVNKTDGVVKALSKKIRFGLATYHGQRKDSVCPVVKTVMPKDDNFSAIEAVYSVLDPVAGTPTAEGVQKVYDEMIAAKAIVKPTFFILATDGLPRACVRGTSAERAQKSVDTLKALFTSGVQTFIIGVGQDAVDKAHLQDLANAGAGKTGADPAKYYEVGEATALRAALDTILGETLCTAP